MSKNSGVAGKTVVQLARSLAAATRKAARDARSHQEQLAVLNDRPGKATRERRRLMKLLKDASC